MADSIQSIRVSDETWRRIQGHRARAGVPTAEVLRLFVDFAEVARDHYRLDLPLVAFLGLAVATDPGQWDTELPRAITGERADASWTPGYPGEEPAVVEAQGRAREAAWRAHPVLRQVNDLIRRIPELSPAEVDAELVKITSGAAS